jgi:tmRNA-binding protein
MGRPSEYDFEMCKEICARVSLGENIKSVLDSEYRFPSFPTFCTWKRNNVALFNLYISCHQDKAEALEQELDSYRDMLLTKEIDSSTYNVLVQTLKWKMAKFYPKVFGDKIQNEISGELKTNPTIIKWGDNEVNI